ncbi:MAG: NUDIX domain-containing protein [Candidatus Heimdallarchaeaceae archaeon]
MPRVQCAVKGLIMKSGKFLAIKQKIRDKVFWDLPGGRVEYGSNPIENLKREIFEEIGIEVEVEKPIGVWYFFREIDNDQVVCTTFLCHPVSTDINLEENPDEEEEIIEYRWVSPQEFLSGDYKIGNESLKRMIKDYFSKYYFSKSTV